MASPCVELSNKMKMPILGLGTWQVPGRGPWFLWEKNRDAGGCCGGCPWVGLGVCLQRLYNRAAGREGAKEEGNKYNGRKRGK